MLIKSFLPRAVCLLLILQIPLWVLADLLAPFTSSFVYKSTIEKVSQDITADSEKTSKRCAEIAQQYNLAWIYITDKNKSIAAFSRPGGLSEPATENAASRVLDLKGNRFVEFSQPLNQTELLAAGFRCPSLVGTLFSKQLLPGQLPPGTVLSALILNLVALLAAYLAFLGIPLARTMRQLRAGQDLPDKFPVYVSSEINTILQAVKSRLSSVKDEYEKSLASSRADLSGTITKEKEERFANRLAADIIMLPNLDDVCKLTIDRLIEEFKNIIKAGFSVESGADETFRFLYQSGLSEEQAKQLAGPAFKRFNEQLKKKVEGICFLKADELGDKQLEQLASSLNCEQCFIVPVEFNGPLKTYLCLFISSKDQPAVQKLERLSRKLSAQVSPIWLLVSKYARAYKQGHFDLLTGVRNRLFLEETMKSLPKQEAAAEAETFFLLFEGDNFRLILGNHGPRTVDKLICELAEELFSAMDKSVRFKKTSSRTRFADFFYRVGGCRFLLVLENSTQKKAEELAEAVIQTVGERQNWAHGMPSWSVSCAVTALAQSDPAECLDTSMVTMDYIRSRRQTGTVVLSTEVAPEFLARMHSIAGDGASSTFDPVALLQTLQQSKKNGILTVTSPKGKVFWSYLENGKPTKARLGRLSGDSAVVEFISEFTDCIHRIQDLSALDDRTLEEMNALGGALIISTPIDELVDFALNARESAVIGKGHLKSPEMIVHPTAEWQPGQIEKTLHKTGKSLNKLYLEVANNLWNLCNGRFAWNEILSKLQDEVPVALVWSAADLLLQNKLIKFSRLRISTRSEGAPSDRPAPVQHEPTPQRSGYVSVPRVCKICHAIDPLSQKYCVHCGSEMPADPAAD